TVCWLSSLTTMALLGNWKVNRSENYDMFMEKMGVNMVKRKLAAHDNLKLTISQDGNKFTVKESSTFRSIEIVFELGVTFNYNLADGTELCGAWTQEGEKLVGKFTRVDNEKELNAVREVVNGEMVQMGSRWTQTSKTHCYTHLRGLPKKPSTPAFPPLLMDHHLAT
ncbi:Fatty acid-binding protein, intestinal, partial [Galemys pyrenaicus]